MKRLLLLLLMAAPIFGQTKQQYVLTTFSNGTPGTQPTSGTLQAGSFGSLTGTSWSTHFPSTGAITYSTPTGSCSTLPPNSGGTQAYTYNTTANSSGDNNPNYATWNAPSGNASSMATAWTCYNGNDTDSLNWDYFTLYQGGGTGPVKLWVGDINGNTVGSQNCTSGSFANMIFFGNGSTLAFEMEASGCGSNIPIHAGTWYQIAIMWAHPSSGTTLLYIGDNRNDAKPAGHQAYWMNVKYSFINVGEDDTQFPMLEYPVPLSDGIINPARTMDWTKTGFNGGVLPDASWTQCGSTLAAGTYTGAAITANMASCGSQTYYKLGPGTFTITGGMVSLPRVGKFVMRGSGSNSTFMVWTGSVGSQCGQLNAAVCIRSSDTTNIGSNPTRYNWTAGYAQGSNQVTLSSTTGLDTSRPTILVLDQCDTGFTGAGTCTGSPSDNSQLYICGTSGTCSFNGGASNHRDQMEMHAITNINGSVVTLEDPLIMPNWASGQTPQAWFFQPVVQTGLEDLLIDVTAINGASCLERFNAYQSWVARTVCNGAHYGAYNGFESIHNIVQSNYLYTVNGAGSCGPGDACGIRTYVASYERIENNITQGYFDGGVFFDGVGGIGNAVIGNVILKTDGGNGTLNNAITEHTTNEYNLFEQNHTVQISQDSTHGLSDMGTRFRNHIFGWESNPTTPVAGTALVDCQGSRYANNIGNVLGTPGYTTTYLSTTNGNHAAYGLGNCGGTPPTDPLTSSTSIRWASYDNVSATNRFCGASYDTGWGTTCSSTSEIPAAASTYPNYVPVKGDTAVGEPALPPSLVYTSRPGWWSASIPFPAIGPDVTSGNLGQCSGALNVAGQFNGMPAYNNTQCGSHGFTASMLGGHVNGNPAMNCYLNVMNGPPDGSGSILPFDANVCYAGAVSTPVASFSPTSVAFGPVPVKMVSSPISVTLTNTGTGNLVATAINMTNAKYFLQSNTCGSPATITLDIPGTGFTLTPSSSCTFQVVYMPQAVNQTDAGGVIFFDNAGNPDTLTLSGIGIVLPPASTMFAGLLAIPSKVSVSVAAPTVTATLQ